MTTFYFNNKKYGPVAENYNELSGKQLIVIANLFIRNLPKETAVLMALKILLDKSLFWFAMISADAKARMLQYTEWVFEKNGLTEQLLPWYRGFVGPKKEFDNLTLAEFHFAERYYSELVTEDIQDAINYLVAVLYRKPKPEYNFELDTDGDARIKFNANEVDYYAAQIRKWPKEAKLAILFFYDGCRQKLLEDYDQVFNGNSGKENEDGMFGIIRGLSGDKYGDIDKVEELNIHTALLELTLQIQEAEEIKSQTPTS